MMVEHSIFDDEAISEANNCWHRVFHHAPCTPLEAMKWALREAEKSLRARGKMVPGYENIKWADDSAVVIVKLNPLDTL